MARPREFDPAQALQRALDVFWRKGYQATSMADLTAAMQIQKASLYGTFGDKHTLYLAALEDYQASALLRFEATLTDSLSPRAGVQEVLEGALERALGRDGKRGCLCVNANVELAPHDEAVAEVLRSHSARVEALLEAALRRAKAAGELPRGAVPSRLASFVFGLLVALNVLGKQRAGRERLEALVEQGLAALTP